MAEPAVTQLPADPRIVPTRFAGLPAAQALLPVICPGPHGHLASASPEEIEAVMRRVWPGGRDAENRRVRGARILLQHLDGFPGGSWQQRWEASGLNEAHQPVNVLIPAHQGRKEICTGAACLFGLRVIRPSLLALRSTRLHGYGERFLAAQHDPLLEDFWKRVQDQPVHPVHHTAALFDVTVALTTQGITLDDLTPEAFLHYVWQSRDQGLNMKARGKQNRGQFAGQLAWPVLHEMGLFPPSTPPTVRAAVLTGRRTLEELIDRYEIRHQGVRQLILDYLARRRSELDYSSLDQHARSLAGLFWAKIEALAPGHPDLRIDAELYEQWREALNTRENGQGKRHEAERILRSVRSFYLDLHSWAVEEPERWAPWVAPCPIPDNALRGISVQKRRTKERIDDRIRQRQPLLPTLVAHLEDRYHHLREILRQASSLAPREAFAIEGRSYQRAWSLADEKRQRRGGEANVRVRDLTSAEDINVTTAEELAFWEWAAVEVLRHSGVRVEELLELTHLSIRQYQRPNGEVIALLVIAPSKTDRERVIPMSAELFAVTAAIIRRHTRAGRAIPLIQRYDQHERRMSEPMPFLFQRQLGTTRRVISPATVGHAVNTGLISRATTLISRAAGYPHDFRLAATWSATGCRPLQSALEHLNLQQPGYVGVFSEDAGRPGHFLDRRGGPVLMSTTCPEWLGFEEHFDQRKVRREDALPLRDRLPARHACLRCPMININPKMLPASTRSDDLRPGGPEARSLLRVQGGGFLPLLAFLRQKRDQTRRLARIAPTDLGMPGLLATGSP